MKSESHTPGPWIFEEATRTIRSKPANYWLATMDSWDGAINNQANAEFIIEAVNSHYALKWALKELLHDCDHGNGSQAWDKHKARAHAVLDSLKSTY